MTLAKQSVDQSKRSLNKQKVVDMRIWVEIIHLTQFRSSKQIISLFSISNLKFFSVLNISVADYNRENIENHLSFEH